MLILLQERRNPPAYVINMMRTILQYKGMIISQSYVEACEARRKSVENAMAIMLSATNGPDELFLEVLDSYIFGKITLDEMEARIDRFEYLGIFMNGQEHSEKRIYIRVSVFCPVVPQNM